MTVKLHFDLPERRISFIMDTINCADIEVSQFKQYVVNPDHFASSVRIFETKSGRASMNLNDVISVSYEMIEEE